MFDSEMAVQTGQTQNRSWLNRLGERSDSRRADLASVTALLACGLMVMAAIDFTPYSPDDVVFKGFIWTVLGVVVFGVALWLAPQPQLSAAVPTSMAFEKTRPHWVLFGAGVALLAISAEISGHALDLPLLDNVSLVTQFLIWLAGVVLVGAGLAGAQRLPEIHWKRLLPLLLIFVVALILRFLLLGDSVRLLIDEGLWIGGVENVMGQSGGALLRAASSFLPTTQIFSLWQAGAVELFGRTLFGMRAISALVGALNVVAVYLLARALFNRPMALAAAFLLASFPPHLEFSRIALAHVADPLVATFAFAFAVRGLRDNRRLDWALFGIFLGLTQYFFEGGRLLFPPLALGWLIVLVVVTRGRLRAQWRGLVVAAIAALVVALPVYYVIVAQGDSFTNRMNASGVGSTYWSDLLADGISPDERDQLIRRFTEPFRTYVTLPDQSLFYGDRNALILPVLVPFALLGVAYAISRWRTAASLLLLWLLATALGNGLLQSGSQSPHFTVVFPVLPLLIALGVYAAWTLIGARLPAALSSRGLIALMAAIGIFQAAYFYAVYLPNYNSDVREALDYPDGIDPVLRWLDLPRNTQIVIISQPAINELVARDMHGFVVDPPSQYMLLSYTPDKITPDLLKTLPLDRGYAFFVRPDDSETVHRLSAFFKLGPPQLTRDQQIPPDRRLVLYYAQPQTN